MKRIFIFVIFLLTINSSNAECLIHEVDLMAGLGDLAVDASTNKVYVSNQSTSTIDIINASTRELESSIMLSVIPTGVAVNSNTKKLYITNFDDDTVSIINTENNSKITDISVGVQPGSVSINQETNVVYVPNFGGQSISVVNGSENMVGSTVPVSNKPFGIDINANTNKIYVTNFGSSSISVINGELNVVEAVISVDTDPIGVAVNPNNNKIYVASFRNDSVAVIDGNTNEIIKTITLGDELFGIACNPNKNRIYVCSTATDEVIVIDSNTDEIIGEIILDEPTLIDVNKNTNEIFVANLSSGEITTLGTFLLSFLENEVISAANELGNIGKELKESSKFARGISNKLRKQKNKIKKAIKIAREEICQKKSGAILAKFDLAVSSLNAKACTDETQLRCIEEEIVNGFTDRIENELKNIESFTTADCNFDDIPDICQMEIE